MKKLYFLVILSLLVGLGNLGYSLSHNGAQPSVGRAPFNATQYFTSGFSAGSTNQMTVSDTGALTTSGGLTTTGALSGATLKSASIGSSSSSPAALGSAASGHFIIAAGQLTASASTTAITANSTILLQIEHTTPIAGTTCNTAATTTPGVASKVAGNGFTVTTLAAPVTNPLCLEYLVLN